MSENPYPELKRPIARLKDDAKKLKKALNISQNEALNIIASQHHCPGWQTLVF